MVKWKSGRGPLGRIMRSREGRFRLALAFLIWSLVPHFQWTVHRHSAAHDGHRHQELSQAEAELADRLAEELSRAAQVLDPLEFGSAASSRPDPSSSVPALQDGRGPASHVHFQTDPNVVALVVAPASASPRIPIPRVSSPGYDTPPLPVLGAAPARGPPSFQPA